ncbi:MAG TPA: hypothetical protein VF286_07585, partial [Acidiphilium sp.]
TIDSASLTGASGDLAVAGTVDLAHHRLNLTATAKPVIVGQKTSPALPVTVSGDAAHPTVRPEPDPAMVWIGKNAARAGPP